MDQTTGNFVRKKQKAREAKKIKKSQKPFSPIADSFLDGWLAIGTIVAPQGLRGEMRVYPDTDFPERFEEPGKRWLLKANSKQPEAIELTSGRYIEGKNLYVITIKGINDCNQVEELRGCKLLVPEDDRPPLGENEHHIADLIGLQVFMQTSGDYIGKIIRLIPAGNYLLEIQPQPDSSQEETVNNQPRKNILIPFVKEIVPVVDLVAKRVEITPPEGLLEIND
ncbi:ribosome maturation factor RimM [Calothrix sp. PCC 6303]|uniref:ribosome maturation factor RimM n=1 Tax=Calothrix sp. PCC 6303 TaxID=1170562 RepID=UPI0002A05704|nr:ribosome maturation factor RimM [Calothrix sp. PCC 6303]AFZ02309.1 16S rRNA processing protein RimM [Calothrix sp. PCC 6303]